MIDDFLDRLEKVKRVGDGKYQACCPVHGDKHPSMSVTEKHGKVLIHCFACGANGLEVAKSLGLNASHLFADRLDSHRISDYQRKRLEAELDRAKTFIRLYEAHAEQGRDMTLKDKRDYRRYQAAIEGISDKLNQV